MTPRKCTQTLEGALGGTGAFSRSQVVTDIFALPEKTQYSLGFAATRGKRADTGRRRFRGRHRPAAGSGSRGRHRRRRSSPSSSQIRRLGRGARTVIVDPVESASVRPAREMQGGLAALASTISRPASRHRERHRERHHEEPDVRPTSRCAFAYGRLRLFRQYTLPPCLCCSCTDLRDTPHTARARPPASPLFT